MASAPSLGDTWLPGQSPAHQDLVPQQEPSLPTLPFRTAESQQQGEPLLSQMGGCGKVSIGTGAGKTCPPSSVLSWQGQEGRQQRPACDDVGKGRCSPLVHLSWDDEGPSASAVPCPASQAPWLTLLFWGLFSSTCLTHWPGSSVAGWFSRDCASDED